MGVLVRWLMTAAMVISLVSGLPSGDRVQAAGGSGDGSGGGQNNPLVIESSSPADGAAGVANLEYIKIVFSKNIVYMTVRDKNLQCFSLWSGSHPIPAEIIMADDQVEREKRNDVLIKPRQPLKAGTAYRVEIAPQLESKSGVILGHKEVISFTMAAEAEALDPAAPIQEPPAPVAPAGSHGSGPATPAGDTAVTAQPGTGSGVPAAGGDGAAPTAPDNTAAEPGKDGGPGDSSGNSRWWIALGATLVAILGAAALRHRGGKS